jgi:hypothetical protein
MNRAARNLRKTLDSVAVNNEAAALEVMRTIEQLKDQLMRQRLLGVVHCLNQDAGDLRHLKNDVEEVLVKRA